MNNSDGVEQYPEFACYYYNERDPRGCVCGKDKTQCGKKVCVANLATMQGKFFCSMYILLVIELVFRIYSFFNSMICICICYRLSMDLL